MKKWTNNLAEIGRYLLIPMSLFILFKKGITKILSKYLVGLVLSNCYPAQFVFDLAILMISICLTIPIVIKIRRGASIPIKWVYVIILYLFYYSYYRFLGNEFQFSGFSFYPAFKLLDAIILIPIVSIGIVKAILWIKGEKQIVIQESSMSFKVDEAVEIEEKDDLLNRKKFASKIVEMICGTQTKNGSFSIGVVASWGSGKTTFLKTLSKELNSSSAIVFELNVWKCNNAGQIIETFFKKLKEALSSYSFTIDNRLQEYLNGLLKGSQNDAMNSLKNLSEIFHPNEDVSTQYEHINSEIKKIGQKIIVLIDDLDRLDKKEIYETIRLIRNTANFAHTYFIVAYDRNYILNALEEINPYQSHYYLEKIFQLEFTLPPISENTIQNEISKELKTILTTQDYISYGQMLDRGRILWEYGVANLTALYIHNLRDVTRFINSFKLNYLFIKGEVLFPDFYNLELIRFKHPELFIEIYRNYLKFFTQNDYDKSGKFTAMSVGYRLVHVDNQVDKETELEQFLRDRNSIFKLTGKDIENVLTAYGSIFNFINRDYYNDGRRRFNNAHLSVIFPSMFDRYFIFGIEGRLSEQEFSKIRALSKDAFLAELTKLAKDKLIINDVKNRFESIKRFDNKDDFDKIVSGIFYFAMLPNINEQSRKDEIWYEERVLWELLVLSKVRNLFDNNSEYRKYIKDLFTTTDVKYSYKNEMAHYMSTHMYAYDDILLFSEEMFKQILFANFRNALERSTNFTLDLWWHFRRCEDEKYRDLNSEAIFMRIHEEAVRLIRRFIIHHDIAGFFSIIVGKLRPDLGYGIHRDSLRRIFENEEAFIKYLKKYHLDNPAVQEFLSLKQALTSSKIAASGVPKDFFKTIKLLY